jgi:hypothetical protein
MLCDELSEAEFPEFIEFCGESGGALREASAGGVLFVELSEDELCEESGSWLFSLGVDSLIIITLLSEREHEYEVK